MDFHFAIVSLSKKNQKTSLQENFTSDLFIFVWSHPAYSRLPKYSLHHAVHIMKGMVTLQNTSYIGMLMCEHTHTHPGVPVSC